MEKKSKLKSLFGRKNKKNLPVSTLSSPVSPINSFTSSLNPRLRIEEELEQVFKKFDVNGDGRICSGELGSIMRSLGTPASKTELANIIKEVDTDGDGFIDLKEFIELNTTDIDSEEMLVYLRDAFSMFDLDKNGSISADELQKVLKSLGEECTSEDCNNMIKGVDVNGDGLICFDEFKVMMMNGARTPKVVGNSEVRSI